VGINKEKKTRQKIRPNQQHNYETKQTFFPKIVDGGFFLVSLITNFTGPATT
jgi:hypothetical protein